VLCDIPVGCWATPKHIDVSAVEQEQSLEWDKDHKEPYFTSGQVLLTMGLVFRAFWILELQISNYGPIIVSVIANNY